ncbi:helix-turn-helix transcriptional regulator [Enterobacter sp. A103]|uniref:helix-turn-helix transcriptional regulator n=1 Tax=Enterobacter sp. A103 TaxID=3102785 RepID=UPI002ACA3D78|nr:LuxR C-terminal-related transcriptional regulator [Enterobacter sp. A103]MDZ5641690.1 LuxR C-terminal-related transcriptional regulator [Enterobacter sp. A103]
MEPSERFVFFTADYVYQALHEQADGRSIFILISSFNDLAFMIPSSLKKRIKAKATLEEWKGLFNENNDACYAPDSDQPDLRYLTDRERQVIRMMYSGFGIHSIARQLGIKASSVYNHRFSAYKKLGCKSSLEFLRLCHLRSFSIWMKQMLPVTHAQN